MRIDLETREIADAELDAVAGGTAHVTVNSTTVADVDLHAPHPTHDLDFARHATDAVPGGFPHVPFHVPAPGAPAV